MSTQTLNFEYRGIACEVPFHGGQFQGRTLTEAGLRPLIAIFDTDQERCAVRLRQRIDDYLDHWRSRSGGGTLKARLRLAPNSVQSANVVDNSLTAADLKGADVNGVLINFAAGAVANGRCKDFTLVAPGAAPGEAVIFSLKVAVPQGMLFSGVRAHLANRVTLKVFNLRGGPSPAITGLPVRVLTIG